jgi:hypothetical protein
MAQRICYDILLFISVLFLPFYISIVLGIVGMFYFSFYIESVIFFGISDLLHGAPVAKFHNFEFILFTSSALGLLVVEFSKTKLKFYADR